MNVQNEMLNMLIFEGTERKLYLDMNLQTSDFSFECSKLRLVRMPVRSLLPDWEEGAGAPCQRHCCCFYMFQIIRVETRFQFMRSFNSAFCRLFAFLIYFPPVTFLDNAVVNKAPFADETTTNCQRNSSAQHSVYCRAPTQIPSNLSVIR